MARRDQPRYINSGYYLLPQSSLAAVPSDYAFDRHDAPRQPKTQKSEYQLASLNVFDAGSRENYHYVTADDLRGLPASGENVVHGNVISLRALRERLDRMDSGFYRPILANGVLYLVPSEDSPRTARSSDSQDSVKTAIQASTTDSTTTAQDPESTRTARFPQSPLARPAAQPEVRLNLHQLKRLLGKELFKDVIRKYKLQHNGRSGEHGRSRKSNSTHTAVELASARTARDTSSSTVVEPGSGVQTARHATSRSIHSAKACPPLSPLVRSSSEASMNSTKSFGAFDVSEHTAREPTSASTRTACCDSFSTRTATAREASARTPLSVREMTASDEFSSKDVDTAVEPGFIHRTAREASTNTPLSVREMTTCDTFSSKDVDTAVEPGFIHRTAREASARTPLSAHEMTACDEFSSKDVDTAVEPGFIYRTAREASTNTPLSVREMTACDTFSSKDVDTAVEPGFIHRTAREASTNTPLSVHEMTACDEFSSKDVDTAVEPDFIQRTARARSPTLSEYTALSNSWTDNCSSSKDVETAQEFDDSFKAAIFGSTSNTSSTGSTDLRAELDDMVASAEQFLAPDVRRSTTEQSSVGAALAGAPVFDARAVRSAKYLISEPNASLYAANLDADVRTARESGSLTRVAESASRATSTTSSTMAI